MPPEQVLRNEQRLGSRVVRRTAEQLVGRFNPEHIAQAIKLSVHEAELSLHDMLVLLQQRADFRLPTMPTRDELMAEAEAMFAKTISLDDIVDRAYDLLIEAVASLLVVQPRHWQKDKSRADSGILCRAFPHKKDGKLAKNDHAAIAQDEG